jgi:hypothetical protein
MGGRRIFLKTFRASLFIENLSNEPNFGRGSISLDSTFNALFSIKGNPFITSNPKPPKSNVGDSQFSPSVVRP